MQAEQELLTAEPSVQPGFGVYCSFEHQRDSLDITNISTGGFLLIKRIIYLRSTEFQSSQSSLVPKCFMSCDVHFSMQDLHWRAMEGYEDQLGKSHPESLRVTSDLASLLQDQVFPAWNSPSLPMKQNYAKPRDWETKGKAHDM